MKPVRTILHMHNKKINDVRSQLNAIKNAGFDAVQLSPLQACPAGDAWYLRYQPFDFTKIEGLGTKSELTRLCLDAKRLGLTIIADVVFNHMAVPSGARREDWLAARQRAKAGDDGPLNALYAKLDAFPHLSKNDFQPWRDMQGEDWDNDNRYEAWGNGEWPELKPTENVINLHNRHLATLFECGVRGFRFDAVKHMRVEHLSQYMQTVQGFPDSCWCYGEVLSDQKAMHTEYETLFPTTDFRFIRKFKALLNQDHPLTLDPGELFLNDRSIRFGMNHDLALNPPHLVADLLFERPEHTRLANCLIQLIDAGTTLVYFDDYFSDQMVRASVGQRNLCGGMTGSFQLSRTGRTWRIDGGSKSINLDLENDIIAYQ